MCKVCQPLILTPRKSNAQLLHLDGIRVNFCQYTFTGTWYVLYTVTISL